MNLDLTEAELSFLLRAIRPEGGGYSKDEAVARLQTRLSMALQSEEQRRVRARVEG